MTTPVGKAPSKTEKEINQKKIEDKFNASDYACEVILERTTQEKSQDRQLPTDAFIVKYKYEGNLCIDVTRSEKMVNIFDMYYDRYGKDAVQKIDYGFGTVRPNLWGAKLTPPKRKKRKG